MAKEEFADPNDLIIIGLDTEDGPEHPLFDERVFYELDEHFVRNIMVNGVNTPVAVREEAGQNLVVFGRQRVRAAREASKRLSSAGDPSVKVPIRRLTGDDGQIMGIMISENAHRKGDDVLSNARKAARLLQRIGDINEVAVHFGRSVTQVRNWLRLVEADPEIHEAIRTEAISASAGIEIAHKPREEQRDLLARVIKANAKSAGQVSESQVKKAKGPRKAQPGIKRTWIRKALKTDAAHQLSPENRAILNWFATGEAEKGTWFDTFLFDAGAELEAPKKPATPKSEDAPPSEEA